MSHHHATIVWQRGSSDFRNGKYSRGHTWKFDGGTEVAASASPSVVPPPHSVADAVDPEEAFVAALSSCHMLWFLSLAAKADFVIDSYTDEAVGTMAKNSEGKMVIRDVLLRPRVIFSGQQPTAEQLAQLHHRAHDECFLANSVKTHVRCEPVG